MTHSATEPSSTHHRWSAAVRSILAKHPWFIVALLFSALLIPWSFIYQANHGWEETYFAHTESRALSNTRSLFITYPAQLPVASSETEDRPLVVWISDTAPLTTTVAYTVTFQHDGELWFSNEAGEPAPAQLVVPVRESAAEQKQLSVRPAPLEDQTTRTLDVEIQLLPTVQGSIEPITVEVVAPAWISFVLDRLLLDIALPLSLAVALTGWALDYSKIRREEAEKERQALLQSFRDQVQTIDRIALRDSVEAVHHLFHLEQQLKQCDYSQQDLAVVQLEIDGLWAQFRQDTACSTHFMGDISQALLQMKQSGATDITRSPSYRIARNLLRTPQAEHLDTLRALFVWKYTPQSGAGASPKQKPPSHGAVVQAVIGLYRTYDRVINELLVQAVLIVIGHVSADDAPDMSTILDPLIVEATDLLKDSRLNKRCNELGLGPVPRSYVFPSPWLNSPIVRPSPVDRWIGISELVSNPFVAGIYAPNPLLARSWVNPTAWASIIAVEHTSIQSTIREDCNVTALMLYDRLRTTTDYDIFPVRLALPFTEVWPNAPYDVLLKCIVQSIGHALLAMLPLPSDPPNANMLLDYMPDEQAEMVKLLTWVAGSSDALRQCVSRVPTPPDHLAENELQQQAGAGKLHQKLTQIIDQALGGASHVDTPSTDTLHSWLAMRPPGMKHTFLIVDVADSDQDTQAQVAALLRMAHNAPHSQVFVKLFGAPEAFVAYGDATPMTLQWRTKDLERMLSTRMYHASGFTLNTLNDCFWLPPFQDEGGQSDVDTHIITYARGSLNRMLQLGQTLFQQHADRNPEERYLQPDDLDSFLQEREGET